jgi:hypothetical protein
MFFVKVMEITKKEDKAVILDYHGTEVGTT